MRRRKIALCGSIIAARGVLWTPANLGASLFEWWDAENALSVPQSAGGVTTWTSLVSGLAPTQGTSSKRPVWSATAFNNRPLITWDATDDFLLVSAIGNMPSGATPSWVWVLASQDALIADATNRLAFNYGTTGAGNSRASRRGVGVTNLPSSIIGSGGISTQTSYGSTDYSGRHLTCMKVGATATTMVMDGVLLSGTGTVTPTTGTVNTVIGAGPTGVGAIWNGGINSILVTDVLSAPNEALLTAYLMARM